MNPGKSLPGFFNENEIMKRINRNPSISKEPMQRVVTFLNRNEVDFLDKLGKDALFSTGLKLSRVRLISWLIDFAEKLKINGKGIKSEEDLEKKIVNILKPNTNTGEQSNTPHQPRMEL